MISTQTVNGFEILTVETEHLRYAVAPACGGKITSIFNKRLQKEFLWNNQNLALQINQQGADYDTNFFGGVDELIPNDIPETVDAIHYPDHGELWTTPLQYEMTGDSITLSGTLMLSGLHYSKTIYPDLERPIIYTDYQITNTTSFKRSFLWKLHAAVQIQPGDRLVTNAGYGLVVDPAWSRFTDTSPFRWPVIEGKDASLLPSRENTVDFFYLYDIPEGEMQLLSNEGQHVFSYRYDTKIFPYQWYFASYGGFLDHYTAILEPCTNMPMSVNDAKELGQCALLEPGEKLSTQVRIFAGEK